MSPIRIKRLVPEASLPTYKTAGAAGADLCSIEKVRFWPGQRRLVRTGIAIELPQGYEAQVRPRSGLALNNGMTVLNAPGTIDSDYRGEIGVLMINLGETDFSVQPGERIAQLVIAPVTIATFICEEEIGETERGIAGFGSTGVV